MAEPARTGGSARRIGWILRAPLALALGVGLLLEQPARADPAAERAKKDAAVQRATLGALSLKRGMRDPDSFRLESALVIDATGAVCYEYRARNGFGGYNRSQAVLAPAASHLVTSEHDGFVRAWNRHCAGKPGQETAAAIRRLAL